MKHAVYFLLLASPALALQPGLAVGHGKPFLAARRTGALYTTSPLVASAAAVVPADSGGTVGVAPSVINLVTLRLEPGSSLDPSASPRKIPALLALATAVHLTPGFDPNPKPNPNCTVSGQEHRWLGRARPCRGHCGLLRLQARAPPLARRPLRGRRTLRLHLLHHRCAARFERPAFRSEGGAQQLLS